MSDYYSQGHSPAYIKSGYDFMQKIGQSLDLYENSSQFSQIDLLRPQLTIATGVIYYHRFFTTRKNCAIPPGTNMVYPPTKVLSDPQLV